MTQPTIDLDHLPGWALRTTLIKLILTRSYSVTVLSGIQGYMQPQNNKAILFLMEIGKKFLASFGTFTYMLSLK